ncbi:MAG: hypothetical protein COB30_014780 [Ectothiorhodospiraceae bacterium]|nr:hypothetical protein [Ectothiorhodospiraceae bacterium]
MTLSTHEKSIHANIIVTSVLVLFMSGCSSIAMHSQQETPVPYAGTKQAFKKAKKTWFDYDYYGQFNFYAIDVPFSFITDTVLYPIDAYRLEQKKKEK